MSVCASEYTNLLVFAWFNEYFIKKIYWLNTIISVQIIKKFLKF